MAKWTLLTFLAGLLVAVMLLSEAHRYQEWELRQLLRRIEQLEQKGDNDATHTGTAQLPRQG